MTFILPATQSWRTHRAVAETLGSLRFRSDSSTHPVELREADEVARGGSRICYRHPTNPKTCLKVELPETPLAPNAKEWIYFRKLQRLRPRYDYYSVARCLGPVATSKGSALAYELICDPDGSVCRTLEQVIKNQWRGYDKIKVLQSVEICINDLLAQSIAARDVAPWNVVIQRRGNGTYRSVLVDGIGHRDFVPLVDYHFSYAKRRISRHVGRFGLDRIAQSLPPTDRQSAVEVHATVAAVRLADPTDCLDSSSLEPVAEAGIDLRCGVTEHTFPGSLKTFRGAILANGEPIRLVDQDLQEYWADAPSRDQWYQRAKRLHRRVVRSIPRMTIRRDDPILFITDNWSSNYFHWMTEALARLESALTVRSVEEMTLIIPRWYRRHRFVAQSLKAYPGLRWQYTPRHARLVCQELLFPTRLAFTGNYSPTILHQIRNRLLNHIEQPPTATVQSPGERIYISRGGAKKRRIINEQSLQPILDHYKIQTLHAERLDVASQWRRMQNASLLIGCHGAGLTNMLTLAPGASVMEIRHPTALTPNCYLTMASQLDQRFSVLVAETSTKPSAKPATSNSDLRIDPDRFESQIKAVLERCDPGV